MNVSRWYVGLAVAVLAAYLVPEWGSFFSSEVFVFSNGWDEPSYLSWQGIVGGRNELGLYSLYLYGLLQEAGLSGAVQNLLSDTIFPLLTVLLVAQSFRLLGIQSGRAFAFAVLALFSSTLFNYANPVFYYLLEKHDSAALLMTGWERYPSLLRTPNPQISYFFAALAIYAWLKCRRFWILLLPLPVLYYYVAVPYAALVSVGVALPLVRRVLRGEGHARIVSAVVIYLMMGVGASAMFKLAGYYDPHNYVTNNPWVYTKTHMLQLPLALLIILAVTGMLWWRGWLSDNVRFVGAMQALALAALASANLHVVTGFMLSQKNYYDYGLSILFGLMLVVMLEWLRDRRWADGLLAALLAVVAVPTMASHVYFYRQAAEISAKAAPIIEEVRRDPLHALIPDIEVSSRMAYSTAKLLAPPYSYQYNFPFIEKQCHLYPKFLEASLMQAKAQLAGKPVDLARLEAIASDIRMGEDQSRNVPYRNLPYCQIDAYRTKDFHLLTVDR